MANDILYDLTPWQDAPSTLTPINAENLNARDSLLKKVVDKTNQLSEQIGNQTGGTGWTTSQINLLDEIGNYLPFTSDEGGSKWDALIESLRGNSSGGEDTDVTLSSISATYSGGSVLVGTSVNDLTGIVVTAKYSDGTTKTVTGYTLSGTIAEGSNTVTISYGGKFTTITVVGYAENEPEITLTNISATYTGGDVAVGTALTDLTGITVTGTYSDGSTGAITGYTLSGEIAEGSNTITVSYGGKTTTFTVTGVAEEEEIKVYGVDLAWEYPGYNQWSANGNWFLTHYDQGTASIQVGNGFSVNEVYSKPIDGTVYKYFRVPTVSSDKQYAASNNVIFYGCDSPNALTEAGHTITKCTNSIKFVSCDFADDIDTEGMTIVYPKEQFDYYYIKLGTTNTLISEYPELVGIFDANILENPLANPTE